MRIVQGETSAQPDRYGGSSVYNLNPLQCNDPAVYEANIKFAKNHGFKDANNKQGQRVIMEFVSKALIHLFQEAGINQLRGGPYQGSCPKGFLQVKVVSYKTHGFFKLLTVIRTPNFGCLQGA